MAEPEVKNPYAPTTPFYSPKEFNYDELLALKYGTEASRRDKRKFKRYWKSDQRHEDLLAFDKAETDKMFASADARFKEINEAWKANNSKPQLVTKPTTPVVEPKPEPPTPSIEDQIAGAKNFNEAFGLARKAGLKEFNWKGKPIAVKLAEPKSPETTPSPTAQQSTPEQPAASSMFSAPWIGYTPTEEEKAAYAQRQAERAAQKPEKKNNWFVNATLGAAMADAPQMMIASGWRQNEAGDFVQDQQDDPGVVALRNNLAALGGLVTAGTAAAALAPVAGAAGASTTLPATVETIVPEVVQTAGVPALRQAGTTAVLAMGRAAGTGAQRALPHYANALYDKAGNLIKFWKQGGTINRINYFQQGGAAPQQPAAQNEDEYLITIVQAALQGEPQATQEVNAILEAAKQGDPTAQQQAQKISQIVEAIKLQQAQQTPVKRYGSKLNYIKSLKYAKGGKTCPACEQKVEMKKCGGKKAKKHDGGGWMEMLPIYGTVQSGKRFFQNPSWKGAGEFALDLAGDAAMLTGIGAGAGAALKAAKAAKTANLVAKTAKTNKAWRAAKEVSSLRPAGVNYVDDAFRYGGAETAKALDLASNYAKLARTAPIDGASYAVGTKLVDMATE